MMTSLLPAAVLEAAQPHANLLANSLVAFFRSTSACDPLNLRARDRRISDGAPPRLRRTWRRTLLLEVGDDRQVLAAAAVRALHLHHGPLLLGGSAPLRPRDQRQPSPSSSRW